MGFSLLVEDFSLLVEDFSLLVEDFSLLVEDFSLLVKGSATIDAKVFYSQREYLRILLVFIVVFCSVFFFVQKKTLEKKTIKTPQKNTKKREE